MRFDILTIFPHFFDSFLNEGLIKKSIQKKLNKFCVHDLRQWAMNKHRQVDDRPYGGGPGMVLMPLPIFKAVEEIKHKNTGSTENTKTQKHKNKIKDNAAKIGGNQKIKVVLLSPAGKQFDQKMAEKFSRLDQIIFICGRYEGVDARVKKIADEEVSVGPYILAGGELAALIIIETVARLIPGYLGNAESLLEESRPGKKEYPQYTRPEVVEINGKKYQVPKILLSGNHQKIKAWRDRKKGIK